jgi:hypothetical protein
LGPACVVPAHPRLWRDIGGTTKNASVELASGDARTSDPVGSVRRKPVAA